jgi:Zn-finger nucleic acid-binding protein
MDCPKCPGLLQATTIEKVEVEVCPTCEGIWFDPGKLKTILRRDEFDFFKMDLDDDEFSGKSEQIAGFDLVSKLGICPRCADGTKLTPTLYEHKHQVQVDICAKGHGLWLDGGEIQKLRRRGLVNAFDLMDYYSELTNFAFSRKGFRTLMKVEKSKLSQYLKQTPPPAAPEDSPVPTEEDPSID